jgi:hypothetical protein
MSNVPYFVANPNDTSSTPDATSDASAGGGAGNAAASQTPPAAAPPQASPRPDAPQVDHSVPAEQIKPDPIPAESWGAKVYHGVLNALGGANDVSFARDPQTGKLVATAVKSGPGQQWKRIISGALTGYAAGAGQTGPGSTARKLGMGIQAGEKQVQDRRQGKINEANQDFEAQQKAATAQAQNALLSHQIAKSTFDLGRAQVEAGVADSERETNFEKVISDGGAGSTDMGVFPSFAEVVSAFKDMPELHDHQAGGRIISIPHINQDGKIDGVHAALVTPDWLNSKIGQELPIHVRQYKDGKVEESTFTIPAGSLTGDQYAKLVMGQAKDTLDDFTKQENEKREAERAKAQNAKDYADAAKARSESTAGGGDAGVQQDIAEGLAGGRYLMGKDIPLRTSKDQATAAQYTKAADDYSRTHYGLPYSPEIIRQEAKFAEAPKTQAFLGGIDRMVGTPGMPGQLDQVLDLAKRAGLGDLAPSNEVQLWVKEHLGLEAAKNFEQGLSDTQTALGTLIGNPLLGSGESDLKLKTAQKQFGSNPTMKDLRGAVTTTKEILNRARFALARNNRYIQQRYGDAFSPQQQPTQQTQQPAAQLPPEAVSQLKEGIHTTFANGQTWTLQQGKPVQVQGK